MRDNTIRTATGADVYKHDIDYYADQYITNELGIASEDDGYKQTVADNFVDMLFYISDRIEHPDTKDIELLDNIFDIYIRLCAKYRVLPTLEMFSFLVGVDRRTFTRWRNRSRQIASDVHGDTVEKWFDVCKNFVVNRLHNQPGANVNLIFVAKAAYQMVETAPASVQPDNSTPIEGPQEIAIRRLGQMTEKPGANSSPAWNQMEAD